MRMRLLLVLIGLLGLGNVAVADTVAKDCGATISCSVSVPNVAVGDLVVIVVRAGQLPTISLVGFKEAGQVDSSDPHRLALFYQYAGSAGSVPVTVAAPGASTLRVTGASFAGPWDTTKVPVFVSAAGSSRTAVSGLCPTSFCIGAVSTANGNSVTVVPNETLIASAGSKVFMLSGTAAANVTLSGSDLWAAAVVGFSAPAVVPPPVPSVTLSALPTSVNQGTASVLSWTSSNATSVTIDNGVGSVTPVAGGSVSVTPQVATTYTATGVGAGGSAAASANVAVTIADTTPPVVSVVTLVSGQNVTGVQIVTISATDDVAVASVQPKIDGVNFGPALTVSPYFFTLDTSTLSTGVHTVGAQAVDTSGNSASASVSVNVTGQLFDIVLVYDDGSAYTPGGSVSISELTGTNLTQTDVVTKVTPTGGVKFRWTATVGVVYLVVVSDASGTVLWNTGTQLTPSQLPSAFSGVSAKIVFSKATGAWAGMSNFTISY